VSAVDPDPEPALADPERQLAWERRHRQRAGIAALVGAVGLAIYFILEQVVLRDLPTSSGLETLQRATQDGPVAQLPSLRTPYFEYLQDESATLLIRAFGGFFGFLGLAWATGFLGVATRARLPQVRRFVIYLPIVGGVVTAVGLVISQLGTSSLIGDFLDSPRTVADADLDNAGIGAFASLLSQFGTLALAVGVLLTALNAMKAGLLTRFFGYVGIAAGAMLIIFPLPVVQVFWLASVGMLLLGRWPGGDLPAWKTGEAVPWESVPRVPRGAGGPVAAPASGPTQQPLTPGARRKRKKRS
jgi:hypothetical protein